MEFLKVVKGVHQVRLCSTTVVCPDLFLFEALETMLARRQECLEVNIVTCRAFVKRRVFAFDALISMNLEPCQIGGFREQSVHDDSGEYLCRASRIV